MLQKSSISHNALVLFATMITFATQINAARLLAPTMSTSEMELGATAAYAAQPNEVLPIQPVLLYPQQARVLKYQARNFDDDDDDNTGDNDNEIIYVKLLKRRSYRPHKRTSNSAIAAAADINSSAAAPHKELSKKDIFYVKALANGQFSHRRVKWYRLPEFYAISVFHKGEQYENQNLV